LGFARLAQKHHRLGPFHPVPVTVPECHFRPQIVESLHPTPALIRKEPFPTRLANRLRPIEARLAVFRDSTILLLTELLLGTERG